MSLLLGVDTGGTYTDAVLIRGEEVLASAKALTTRHDLAIGIGEAVRSVVGAAAVAPGEIGMASLSTTLATNALVEGQGGRVALIYIGFEAAGLERHGLREALRGDPVLVMAGGHDHSGRELAPLDLAALEAFLTAEGRGVSGFAVAGRFATRNPAHELAVARLVTEMTGTPATCSHHLSARLNGPKRAVTAVLNARLIGMIDRLIGRAQHVLAELGIDAPLMVVRGDGALMSAAQARSRPIETILSGPAASIVGARWLTGVENALVSDIGGTTTDVALLRDGRPAIAPEGARVGGFQTMVEAVAMRTWGLGGDSQVHLRAQGLVGGVTLGPRRVVPVSLLAHEAPEVVHAALDADLRAAAPGEMDAVFVRAVRGVEPHGRSEREAHLLERLAEGVQPLRKVLRNRMDRVALSRLEDRGLVQLSGITPSDAAHVLGWAEAWDREAAEKALTLWARKRIGSGEALAADPHGMAQLIVDQLVEQTVQALLEAALAEEAPSFGPDPADLARHVLMRQALGGHRGLLRLDAAVNVDIVGLGASAPIYYPAVGERLRGRMILPEHAGVANAIGAVVGQVTMRRRGVVTVPAPGRFRAHLPDGPQDFADADAAMACLELALRREAAEAVERAGVADAELGVRRERRTAEVEGRRVLVEAEIVVEASGRPRVAVA
ncbi:hydantoinase/oxoprolinase N-terminal domain-containing protein [Jhaorihella thermophila]|uniref:N-methylhydantoinase A/oxoprolinase/acetone carboxylase, beta subunit n=1 Tax=Jhaorihella thermophila TaxID=488547 RepID=A0A1H5XJ51_9RHOB|nr:hydantoinase/oxoprolinase family protein [Jhaorihella thermophila]SEG11814.1 N-methylhydantoinase A/oxoprolinase/acetone carboxylase, beta subunit [Jhaorihella thermophila]